MSDYATTTAQVDPAVSLYYDRVLLVEAFPALIYMRFPQLATMPKKAGNTYKWRRYANFAAATVPVTEGVTPPGVRMSKVDITAQISQYMNWILITDWVDMTVEDQVFNVATSLLGLNLGLTQDTLMRDILAATASATNAAGGSNGKTPTEITTADTDAIKLLLRTADAKEMVPTIMGSDKVGTVPIRESFWCIVDRDVEDDLDDMTGFVHKSEYGQNTGVLDEEYGAVRGIRFLTTTNGAETANGDLAGTSTVYDALILGMDAYGSVKHDMVERIFKPFGSGGTEDPGNQRATQAYKFSWAGRILNDTFMHNLKITHS